MRLATFNILHGRSLGDGRVDTERLAEACRTLDADVLCLQEIDRGQSRSHGVDQTAAIAAACGASGWRFQPAIIGEPGATWRAATDDDDADEADEAGASGGGPPAPAPPPADGGGESGGAGARPAAQPGYGVAIVSRRPVRTWHVMRLKAAPVKSPVAVPGGKGRFILLPDEPRVVLAADLGDLVVATTHLSFVPGYNLVQLRRATRWLETFARPTVLLGDLNFPGALPRVVTGWRPLVKAKTYPADRPGLQVDHVLARGPVSAVAGTAIRPLPLSDHRAVVVDLVG